MQNKRDRETEDRKGVRMQQAHSQEALETELPCGPASPDSSLQREQVFQMGHDDCVPKPQGFAANSSLVRVVRAMPERADLRSDMRRSLDLHFVGGAAEEVAVITAKRCSVIAICKALLYVLCTLTHLVFTHTLRSQS